VIVSNNDFEAKKKARARFKLKKKKMKTTTTTTWDNRPAPKRAKATASSTSWTWYLSYSAIQRTAQLPEGIEKPPIIRFQENMDPRCAAPILLRMLDWW
jgi:hypothetical protein